MNNKLKKEIIDFAHSIGIDSIGFTTADPFDELKQKLEEYHAKGYASGFEESNISLRTEPKLSLPSARSIIAIAVGYPNKLKGAPKSVKGDRRGMFARASWGQDYHSIICNHVRFCKIHFFFSFGSCCHTGDNNIDFTGLKCT